MKNFYIPTNNKPLTKEDFLAFCTKYVGNNTLVLTIKDKSYLLTEDNIRQINKQGSSYIFSNGGTLGDSILRVIFSNYGDFDDYQLVAEDFKIMLPSREANSSLLESFGLEDGILAHYHIFFEVPKEPHRRATYTDEVSYDRQKLDDLGIFLLPTKNFIDFIVED